MLPLILGPRYNIRVTCDASPSNDRSESTIEVNPTNPYNMVGSSKRFTDPHTYAFSLAAYSTFDAGRSWQEAAPLGLLAGWDGVSDPTVAFDDVGGAYLVALPFQGAEPMAIAVYKSTDGGLTWSAPNLIHSAPGDDKQSAAGDTNPGSPYHGRVYAAWDGPGGMLFGRTIDYGASWRGTGGNPVGTSLAPASFGPQVVVAADSSVYIFFIAGTDIQFVKSTDGGDSFSNPATVASGITGLPGQLPGGTFRTPTVATASVGVNATDLVVAWADYRQGIARIYYARSNNGGAVWQAGSGSGMPLMSGGAVSAPDQHEFQPQLACTPQGDVGCDLYLFGPKGGGTTPLIDVVLTASADNAASFVDRATVTEMPWDPTVDAVWAHGDPNVTFIGDYFGLAASQLGFFPLWMDTRTGTQEMFTARVAARPANVYIRDSSSDTGTVPSPGNHWEAPDLIVRRQQDGNAIWVDQDLLRDGVTDHFIYGKITNLGPNPAENVTLAVTVGNYPALDALPGLEFRYPQDWYPGDWQTAAVQQRHLYLGESAPMSLAVGATRIFGPIRWPAAQIPQEGTWHPCLLAEARGNNNDSAGGTDGAPVSVAPGTCDYGSYFWGDNNVCQRNLSYAHVFAAADSLIELPFIIGSPYSHATLIEVIVHKGHRLADVPMKLAVLPPRKGEKQPLPTENHMHGAEFSGKHWNLTHRVAGVGFTVAPGQTLRMKLSLKLPKEFDLDAPTRLTIFQRNDSHVTTGSAILELVRGHDEDANHERKQRDSSTRKKGR
ncbi:sialidase family protein [Paraburkholderia sp. 40]|uniref:sialidase family protein n=1 Tax=Paraburkholderia sp. 40 TaxID=2991059 RepID=UPI003D1CEFFE